MGTLADRIGTSITPTLEGALDNAAVDALDEVDWRAARQMRNAHPFQLGILRPGEIASPDEIEPGFPCWFSAPRFAKAAGAAFLERHPEVFGYDVVKVTDGHWRSVHIEYRV